MRYSINFDKTINQLIPHYLGGRKIILYLQALMKPLQVLNDTFNEWAKETRIEASMTSQVIRLEWFLNHKLHKYFSDSSQSISIKGAGSPGVPVYHQSANIPLVDNMLLDNYIDRDRTQSTALLNYEGEKGGERNCSFMVYAPVADSKLISEESYKAMIRHWVDRYRVANKTYSIILY